MEYLHTNEDGTTTKYTEDMIKNAIIDRDHWQNKYYNSLKDSGLKKIKVYDFFKERYESGEDEITVSVDDVNYLLEAIGSTKLKSLFTVTGIINFTVTDVEAESEDEATNIVQDYMNLEFAGDGNLDDWDVEVNTTDAQ